jgi:hypothetical protein
MSERNNTIEIDGTSIPISSHVSWNWDTNRENRIVLFLKTAKDEGVEYPCAAFNMQTDYANFESIAFAVWCVRESCEIELGFQRNTTAFKLPNDFVLSDLYDKKIATRTNHYMRFLYRAWKMKTLYSGKFFIAEDNKADVERFGEQYKNALDNGCLQYSAPDGKAGIKEDTGELTENHLEKWFVLNGIRKDYIVNQGPYSNISIRLNDQLPCGIFYGKKSGDCHRNTRILNGGAIDLWGIDDSNQIHIFELKEEKNAKLGMIAELFFYSCVIIDILQIGKGNRKANHRGFFDLWKENVKKDKINAIFLTPGLHSFLAKDNRMENIIELMNERSDKKVEYGYIKFDQNKIKEEGIGELIHKWDNQTEENLYS